MQRKWKRRWQRLTKVILPPVAAGLLSLSAYSPVLANPAGGTVMSGSVNISNSGATTTINQTTDKAIINWQSFSVGKGEIVNFVQPGSTSVALNRVIGSDGSSIYGSLKANGKVYLINPNGILFAPGSSVNVGGMVASNLNISDSDFLNGKYTFQTVGSTGSVVNQGHIIAGNEAVLIGAKAANEGVIAAKVTGLAAGSQVSLDFSGDNLLNVTVDTGALNGSATNTGTITASGGLVVMSAGTKDKLLSTVVNNSGVIRAQSVNNVNGVIRLEGNTVINSGSLDASGKAAGQTGGTVKLLGDTVTVKTDSHIDVSGDAGGGSALIGGAYQGGASEYTVTNTTVENGATITADAVTSGNGGQVVIWANDTTSFAGSITARGGSISGNGGSVETSGKQTLAIIGGRVNTTATNGQTGSWLLDPADFTIGSGMTGTNYWNNSDLQIALATNNITIKTGGSANTVTVGAAAPVATDTSTGSSNGDINVNNNLTWTSANTLTLSAYNNINLNASITAANGGLTLAANTSGSGNGTTTGIITPAAGSSVNVGTFTQQSGTWREISGSLSSFYAKDFRISGGTFLRAKSGNGASTGTAYQIADVYGLQGIGSAGLLGSYYTLANNIDASGTQYWNYNGSTAAGFAPIGNDSATFSGSFNGAGHTITGLTINRSSSSNVGLFGCFSGAISNMGLVGVRAAGLNNVGGLVGRKLSGNITGSYSTGEVTGSSSAGGLVGVNSGSIENSYSTGAVTGGSGSGYVGGLVGYNSGSVKNSYSTGAMTGGGIGGLVGGNSGSIENSYSTGAVTSSSGSSYVGGLVGSSSGSIKNSYSTGAVTSGSSSSYVGGLLGYNYNGSIENSYSTGAVTGGGGIGGLLGYNSSSGTVTNCYWDVDASGKEKGIGSGIVSGANVTVTGLTTAQMRQASSYASWGSDIVTTGGGSSVWRIYDGYTTPLLRSFLTGVTVTATPAGKTYDGTAAAGSNLAYTLSDPAAAGSVSGSLSYATSSKNAGNYSTADGTLTFSGIYSGQQGYDISYAGTTLTINKANLTVTANNATKIIGQPNPVFTAGYSGLGAGDNPASLTGSLLFDTAATAASGPGAYTITLTGTLASPNYTVSYVNGILTVAGRPVDPVYDGAVIHADHTAAGLFKPYGRLYGLGEASSYLTGDPIVGIGINTGGYLLLGDTEQ